MAAIGDGFDIVSYEMGRLDAGGGGGGDITVESKSISANGTYTAPAGKAYSPVSVNVPNSYAAGDEGKVVSNGALVAQGSDTVTQNGTVDTTLISSLAVNVSGGSGLAYETGTWTPASDIADITIPFVNSHEEAPFFYAIEDVTITPSSTFPDNLAVSYFCGELLFGSSGSIDSSSIITGIVGTRYKNSSSGTGGSSILLSNSYTSKETPSTIYYPKYWATNTSIKASTNGNTRYWLAGRTYKWIAVWKPTTS